MTIDRRATGWLDALHHARFREWLLHALGRHGVVCPVYCLMPDHAHFLWAGMGGASDQREAARLLRRAWNGGLERSDHALQRQSHDHVLRWDERRSDAVAAAANYVLENPVRAGLVTAWRDYPFSGAMVPGYPSLDPREGGYWDLFWRIYTLREAQGESLTASATVPPPPVS